uniref:Uncharacterized protein n=1 Tax=Arundo donax TaxID=35708 RepID=A0A0A9DHX8_ARUDO
MSSSSATRTRTKSRSTSRRPDGPGSAPPGAWPSRPSCRTTRSAQATRSVPCTASALYMEILFLSVVIQ